MTELEAAQQIRDGQLPSPTKFGQMALFALRVTGTGLSYRSALDEYVWRDPSIYLNDEFLARCNGLPVIWEHPTEASSLNSKEFESRIIGTVMLPYIQDEDVWAICRIYDGESIKLMTEGQLSTSPSVVFKPTDGNETVKLTEGEVMLIEGKPSYLDHLAVCAVGVWDKEGPPTGVQNDNLATGAAAMAEEDKDKAAADAARHDEALRRMDSMDAKFDAIMDAFKKADEEKKDAKRFDSARKDKFGKRKDGESYKDWKGRHDADEKAMCDALKKDSEKSEEDCSMDAKDARKDAEEEEKRGDKDFDKWAKEEEEEPEHKEDKKDAAFKGALDKKDAEAPEDKKEEEKEEKAEKEEEKPDAKKDSTLVRENTEMKLRLERLERTLKGMTAETSAADRDALANAQSRADSVAAMFGDRAPVPLSGEAPLDYRKRLLKKFQKHSSTFAKTNVGPFDTATIDSIEERVYADACNAARTPGEAPAGVLLPVVTREGGRDVTRFHGDISAFMDPFVPQSMQLVRMNRNPKGMN